jgi:predicted metal-binding transcription factor (methanogenesis marker protein 9)
MMGVLCVHTIKHILLLSATSVKYTLISLQETCFSNLVFSCENIMFRKVRDELEHLLDDEMDMAEMYLTEKLTQQEISEASSRAEVEDPSHTEEDRQVS